MTDEPATPEVSPENLNPEKLFPDKEAEAAALTSSMPSIANAPAAVKRSMPMALSICFGILLAAAGGIFLPADVVYFAGVSELHRGDGA